MLKLSYWGILLFLMTSGHSLAQTMIHLTTESWAPNNYLSKEGKIVGLAVDKVHQIFAKAKLKYDINMYPWSRSYNLALNQPNTAVFSIIRSKQREPLFQWVCPLVTQGGLHFIRLSKRVDIKLAQLADAKNYMIAVSRDEFDHHFLVKNGFKENRHIQVTADHLTNVKLLLSNRAELIISTKETVIDYMTSLNRNADEVTAIMPLTNNRKNPICLAFNLKTPKATIDKLRAALKQVNDH